MNDSCVVLVVEDDPKMAALIQRALGHVDIDSRVARTGDEALWHLRQSPDIGALVLDVMIPHPDGIEVCRQARRDGHRGPIVMISARGGETHRVRALDAGADLFLSKPFPLTHLARTVARLVDQADGKWPDRGPTGAHLVTRRPRWA
jgi:DNA-binding response OmpR family regulator